MDHSSGLVSRRPQAASPAALRSIFAPPFSSRGPKKTAEWLGVPRKAISQLNSPIDMTLLRRFAQSPSHQPGETLYEFMRMVGDDLLGHLHLARERIAFAAAHVERWSIPHAAETIEALFLPSTAMANYIRSEGLGDVIQVIAYPDRRGLGYGIGRYEDHPRFDFSRVQSEPDVHFAHKSGFMCKTTATDPDRLRALIAGAHIDVAGDS